MRAIVMEAVNGTYDAAGRTGAAPRRAERAVPPFEDLLRVHGVGHPSELRDVYTPSDLWFQAWLTGNRGEFERLAGGRGLTLSVR
jgi:hypothetical protein